MIAIFPTKGTGALLSAEAGRLAKILNAQQSYTLGVLQAWWQMHLCIHIVENPAVHQKYCRTHRDGTVHNCTRWLR
jgi:hypothetical protein